MQSLFCQNIVKFKSVQLSLSFVYSSLPAALAPWLSPPCSCRGQGQKQRAQEFLMFQCQEGRICRPQRTFPQHGQTVTDPALCHQAATFSSHPWTWSPIKKGKVERFFFTLVDSTWYGQNFHKPLCFTGPVASENFGPVSLPVNTVTKNIWNQILTHTKTLFH